MLIMNQSKDTVYNLDKITTIDCLENGVVVQCDKAESYIVIGTYKDGARAKEVLRELLFSYGRNTFMRDPHNDENYDVRDIYIMPKE